MALAFEQFAPPGTADRMTAPGSADPEQLVDEATIREAAALAERAAERIEAITRIAAALEDIASQTERLRSDSVDAAARALGAVAETLLPAMARDGFAACLAETACEIAGRTAAARGLRLTHSPDDQEALEAALAAMPDRSGIDLHVDPVRDPGSAEIAWADGGASIDAGAMAAAALEEARRRLMGAAP